MNPLSSTNSIPSTIYLVRHGNTFEPGEKIVWVGAHEDLDLTPTGNEQATSLATALQQEIATPPTIFHSPLKRTAQTAQAIAAAFTPAPKLQVAEALREIDFGSWANKTDGEIIAEFGQKELELWQTQAIWPQKGRWGMTQQEKASAIQAWWPSLTPLLKKGTSVILVTSNGIAREILRFLHLLDPLLSEGKSPKLGTGAYGILQYQDGLYQIDHWDQRPQTSSS